MAPASAQSVTCRHCGSTRTEGHGSFTRKDGTRQPRRLCRACGRTYNEHTGTPLNYIKKRTQWAMMMGCMPRQLSVRRMAATLRVKVATAFRWRHRVLKARAAEPQPILAGHVIAAEVYVPYSEKGSWTTGGPGARRERIFRGYGGAPVPRPFRRMREGRPSCVLLASSATQQAVTVVGQGRPRPDVLEAALAQVLAKGTCLLANGLAPYADACRRLGQTFRDALEVSSARHPAGRLCGQFYRWIQFFRGVATKYLPNYLAWFSQAVRLARCPQPADAPSPAA
ncbi:MAG TPA: hypothetical protein VNT75_04095 [Symbiobacteriaceae bacterium]|nr:hypothetical protein [Symbiobacteriaceae bacterium]